MKPVGLSVLQAPGSGFTPESFEACAKAYGSADCDQLLVFGFRPSACQIAGTLDNGAACGDGSQCRSGACATEYFQMCGVCADRVPAGGHCSKLGQCPAGQDCVSPGTCMTLAGEGKSCSQAPCGGELKCVDGICKAPLLAGAACATDKDYCDVAIGLHCDSTTQTCVDLSAAALGAVCSNGETCLASGSCNAEKFPAVCEAATEDGSACSSNTCKYPALCHNKVCTLSNPAACK